MSNKSLHVDKQHARLSKLIKRLDASHNVSVRAEVISETLNELTKLASEHFKDEEELLEEHGYPELDQHKAEHRAYRLRVVAFCCDVVDRKGDVPEKLLQFIQKWWVDHHEGADRKADEFLRGLSATDTSV